MPSLNQNRHLIIISGTQAECLNHAKQITANIDCLLLADQKKAHTFLGQEFDAVIFDCHPDPKCQQNQQQKNSFDPNAFGAITGTIRGNGYLILLKPKEDIGDSLFLKRFWAIVSETEHLFIDSTSRTVVELKAPQQIIHETSDQNNAVDKIIHVLKGHRRRPLVITADRGRGKSASLGIAAAKLFDDGYKNIIVCAPSKKTAAIIFKHALADSPECQLTFYSPDELQQKKPEADLVLIDEAAAIPVGLLTSFLKCYSRIVFATTQHGYEGSGRGFSINFKKVLDKLAPEWVSCELSTPIRWSKNDTIEKFVFESLLLNAEPAVINQLEPSQCKIVELDKAELIENTTMLSELFGLLVSAHYQTKPSDLMYMLDDDLVSIHVTQFNNKIIAVVLLIQEGGIDSKIATDIFEGTRRLQGHLVAQSLAANVGIEKAPCLHGERIIRIAVHPDFQQQGFGSALLKSLIQKSKADYLSTSFGASTDLLQFWLQLNFTPVYLGMKRDASSGTHSVVMLCKKTEEGKVLIKDAEQRFAKSFYHLLSESFKDLGSELVLALLSPQPLYTLTNKIENKELTAFAEKQRGYENTLYAIWNVVCSELSNDSSLTKSEQNILVLKVLQKHSWQVLTEKMDANIHGKKDALKLLRQAVGKLIVSSQIRENNLE
jgi:tRNA(Met) cytidine acetyltransferase